MKRSKLLSLLLVMMLAAMFVVGCPEDDDDDSNPTGPSGGDLTAEDLSSDELSQAAEDGMVTQTELGIGQAMSMKTSFNNGGWAGPDAITPFEGFKQEFQIADPPEGFTGPDNEGWYTAEDYQGFGDFMVRLTPDVWDPEHEGEDVTKVEYKMYSTYSEYATIEIMYDYWGEVNAARTMFDGAWSYSYQYVLDIQGQEVNYEYAYNVMWSDVSLVEGDYAGHYESELFYPIFGQNATPQLVKLETMFDINSDGTGTGTGYIAGEEYVRFVVDSMSFGGMTGHYTLKSEDWEIEHAF
ncbi:hypothetical protein KQI52_08780 [bacterium]|nr:hypothetical protein [bacterium]